MAKDKKNKPNVYNLVVFFLASRNGGYPRCKKAREEKKPSLIIAPWAIRSWTPHDLSIKSWAAHQNWPKGPLHSVQDRISPPALQDRAQFHSKSALLYFSAWPPWRKGKGEEKNILPLLFHIYSSWPTKKQHLLTARPVSKNPFTQPSSLEAL